MFFAVNEAHHLAEQFATKNMSERVKEIVGTHRYNGKNGSLNYYELVNQCNNVAFTRYSYDLKHMYKRRIRNHSKEKVFIGKENLFSKSYGWSLVRYVDSRILSKFLLLYESGVYNQFRNMTQKQDPKVRPVPTKLSIKGNILSIFLCWSIGLSAAFVVFAIRDTPPVLQIFRNSIICFIQFKTKTVNFVHVYIKKIATITIIPTRTIIGNRKTFIKIDTPYLIIKIEDTCHTIFVVPKPDGTGRFILNLKKLNTYLMNCHFKMEDYRSVMALINRNWYTYVKNRLTRCLLLNSNQKSGS